MSRTVAASSVRGLLAYTRALGLSLAETLDEAALVDPEHRVPEQAYNALWAEAERAAGDPDFGLHFAENLTLEAFDVVGHLLVRSATLSEGLDRVVAYSRILHDAGRVEAERRGDRVSVFPGCRGLMHPFPRPIAEFAAASVLTLIARASDQRPRARRVTFRHAAPPSTREHQRIFGTEPEFGAAETEVELDAAVLDWPIVGAEPSLVSYLDAYAKDVVAKLPVDDALRTAVERALARAPGDAIGAVAARLGLSARTIQRRLSEEGTTFAEVQDRVRRALAERYLADDRLAIGEIAFLLGFAEQSSFQRAFRRWTGQAPGRYRELSAASMRARG